MMRPCDNPFRSECIDRLTYRPIGTTWPAIIGRLEAMHYRGAVVGPHGSGKTTLLDRLSEHLRRHGWRVRCIFINDATAPVEVRSMLPLVESLGARDVVLLDGADLLGRWAWRTWERRMRPTGGLIIASHRAGLLPTLVETSTHAALLAQLMAQLIDSAPDACMALCEDLIARHRGDVRAVWRELYDRAAEDAEYFTPLRRPAAERGARPRVYRPETASDR
ncbi:MAG: hypothetical protein GC162_16915 [Planctomycetes bacterium]|nr:hypothetical protein [Planctomycetota bacterium]